MSTNPKHLHAASEEAGTRAGQDAALPRELLAVAREAAAAGAAVLAERELAHSLTDMVMSTPPYRALRTE